MHDSLAGTLTEGVVELVAVVLGQVVPNEGLTAVLVHPLKDLTHVSIRIAFQTIFTYLVGSRISETGEQREKTGGKSGASLVLEDDGVELRGRADLKCKSEYVHF